MSDCEFRRNDFLTLPANWKLLEKQLAIKIMREFRLIGWPRPIFIGGEGSTNGANLTGAI